MKHLNSIKCMLLVPLVVLMASISSLAQPLSGVYTIGGTSPSYATLAAAASDLNTKGVNGPVWFKIRTGSYTSNTNWVALINNVAGASATNRITFESESGNKADVTIANPNSSTRNYIFRLNGASYITVRNMTLENTATSYCHLVEFASAANSDSVYNCNLINPIVSSTSTNCAAVYAAGLTGGNNTLYNNVITNGSYGVYWEGSSSTTVSTDDVIAANTITLQYNYGIRANNTSGLQVTGNTISKPANTTTYYAMYFSYGKDALKVKSNTVNLTGTSSTHYGIYATNCQGSATGTARAAFSSNTINMTTTTGASYPLYFVTGNTYDSVLNNTVTQNSTSGSLYTFYDDSNTGIYVSGNAFTATSSTSGTIYNEPAYYGTNCVFTGNTLTLKTASGTLYPMYYAARYGNNNVISNNTVTGTATTSGAIYAWHYAMSNSASGNTASGNNMTFTQSTSGAKYGWNYCFQGTSSGNTATNNNIVFTGGTGTVYGFYYSFYNNGSGNTFTGNTLDMTTGGTGTLYAFYYSLYSNASGNVMNNNKLHFKRTGTSGTTYGFYYSIYSNASGNSFSGNNFLLDNNGSGTTYGMYYSVYSNSNGNTLNNNKYKIEGVSGTNYGMYYSIYSGSSGNSFSGNTFDVQNVTSGSVYCAYYSMQSASGTTVDNDTFKCATGGTSYSYGIYYCGQSSPGFTFTNNVVYSSSAGSGAYGAYLYGNGSTNAVYSKNKVYVNGNGSGTVYGLYCYYGNNLTVTDNESIAIGGSGTCYGMTAYYITDGFFRNNTSIAKSSGTCYALYNYNYYSYANEFQNNTFSSSGTGNSYGAYIYQYPGATPPGPGSKFYNNIIANMSSSNPAVYFGYLGSPIEMDYNNLYSRTTSPVSTVAAAQYSYNSSPTGAWNLAAWRALPYGNDRNSLAYNPGFRDSLSDLRPDPARPESWSVNGRGVHITGNNKDMLGNTRVTTKPAGVPDLGAYEFTPTSTPPVCVAAPLAAVASGTQVYTFGQDTVLTVTWPATGTLPTSLDVRQYTGTIAPGINALGSTYMYFYADVEATPVGTYTSTPRLYYKKPWTGTSAETALRMAQKDGVNPWVAHPHSVSGVDAARSFIYMNSMSNFGLLTGADIANNAGALAITAPLPRFCAGNYTLKAKIANLGNNTINNVSIGWSVDGVQQTSVPYNTAIPTMANGNNEVEITLGNITFASKAKWIKIWTSNPNGVVDPVPSDDTILVKWGPGLSGEYTVGGTTPDYATLTDALADLDQFGVCGPVWFKVRPGSYTGQYTLANAAGMNATNRVTIEGESSGVDFVSATRIFWFNGASFFTLKNISISPSTAAGTGLMLSGASSQDSIVNCTFNIGTTYPGYAIDMNNSNMSGTDLYVGGNTFNGGYYALYYYMYPYVMQYRWTFENNTFLNYLYGALYLNNYTNQYDFKINNNYFSTSSTGTPRGIMMYYASGSMEMKNNTIIQTNSGYGIYNYYSYGSATKRHTIANNVVVIGGSNTYNYGLYAYYNTFTDVINNSINYYGTGTTNATAAYLYNTSGNNKVLNNVFANTGGGPAIMPYTPLPSGEIMDYNNLYATGAKLAVGANNSSLSYDSLTLWRATGADRNSISYDPGFMNQTNLQPDPNNPASWSLNGRGVHVAGNDKDMLGNPRVVNREDGVPDIGAYEFVPNTIPPVAKAIPATITAGGTQVFTFGQDTVARIVWDPTTVVPSNVTVRQYTGTVPPSFPKSRHMYFYTDIETTPVTYLLDADIYYKDPWTGKIPAGSEASIKMLRKEAQTTPWTAYNGTDSKADVGRNTLTSDILTGLGHFTGIEGDSMFSVNIAPTSSVVFCPGGSVTLQAGAGGPGYTYQWLINGNNITGATGNSYTAIQAGDYSVIVNNGTETVTSNKVAVTIVSTPSALVTVNGPTTICSGNTVTLNANTGNGLTYQWVRNGADITGATTPSLLVTAGGSYSIKVKNIGCVNISAPVTIVQAPVAVELGNDTSFCALHPLNLDAGNPGATYTWSTGATTQTITLSSFGKQKIWVSVDAGVNCIAKDTIEVDISPMPSVVGISSIKTSNNVYQLQPNGAQNVSSYLWIFGDGSTDTSRSVTHQYQGGRYTLKLVVFNGCGSDTTTLDLPMTVMDVTKGSAFELYPNPAQDRITFEVYGDAMFNDIVIVNSIGQIVFREQGTNTKQRTYNVQGLPDGHYLIRANTSDDKIISKPFQIIR